MSKGVQIHGRVEEGGGAAWRGVAKRFFSPRPARATAGEECWNFARLGAVKITGQNCETNAENEELKAENEKLKARQC